MQLSRSFALARWFGVASDAKIVDAALVKALGEGDPIPSFAASVNGCVAPNGAPLGEGSVVMTDGVAVVKPGRAPLSIPADAKAVAIDVRGLPAGPELEQALASLVPVLGLGDVVWPKSAEVHCEGMPDEVFSAGTSTYSCHVARADALLRSSDEGGASAARPLAVITGARLAPEAALFAASLRLANRAWLVGENVMSEVAELAGVPGPTKTAFVRTRVLSIGKQVLPDVVAADHRALDASVWLRSLPSLGDPPALEDKTVTRTAQIAAPKWSRPKPVNTAPAAMRASIVGAHAAVRTFFPYFGTIPDTWDAAALEALGKADHVTELRDQARVLRELGVVLEDGHQLVNDTNGATSPAGYAALDVDVIDGNIIVTASQVAGIDRGDRILSVDGELAADRMTKAMARISGSPGRRRSVAAYTLLAADAPAAFEVESPTGVKKTVTVAPAASIFGSAFRRAPGALTDLGADDVYYVSLDGEALEGADVAALDKQARSHRALVLDMRGYPGPESWSLAARLLPAEAKGFELRVATVSWRGELSRELVVQTAGEFGVTGATAFPGPIAMLIGHVTQSSAEHLAFFFENGRYAKLVGRTSSGANGNITGIQLPAGLAFTFTGMEVRHPGGGRFHGIGLQPDVPVEPTRADIAAGKDTVLAKGIEVVNAK